MARRVIRSFSGQVPGPTMLTVNITAEPQGIAESRRTSIKGRISEAERANKGNDSVSSTGCDNHEQPSHEFGDHFFHVKLGRAI